MKDLFEKYKGRKVFVTGHTGFKGTWLCKILVMAGAEVTGYSLEPPPDPDLFSISGVAEHMHSVIGVIRDLDLLKKIMADSSPEIVIHMAAQPIVRESYTDRSTELVKAWFASMQRKYPEINTTVSDFITHLLTVWMFTMFEE